MLKGPPAETGADPEGEGEGKRSDNTRRRGREGGEAAAAANSSGDGDGIGDWEGVGGKGPQYATEGCPCNIQYVSRRIGGRNNSGTEPHEIIGTTRDVVAGKHVGGTERR